MVNCIWTINRLTVADMGQWNIPVWVPPAEDSPRIIRATLCFSNSHQCKNVDFYPNETVNIALQRTTGSMRYPTMLQIYPTTPQASDPTVLNIIHVELPYSASQPPLQTAFRVGDLAANHLIIDVKE